MEECSTYQYIVAKGVAKGELREAKKLLMLLGRKRFGPPEVTTAAAIEAIPAHFHFGPQRELCQRTHPESAFSVREGLNCRSVLR